MAKAVWIHETGGPEVLSLDEVAVAAPGAGEVVLRHTVLGLNYIDIGMREGRYPFVKVPMAADRLIRLPDEISDEIAAAATLQGLTAEYLLHSSHALQPGETVLVHAAAGGVGLLLCQWAKAIGATVIGTVGTEAKAEIARAHGCNHSIVYTTENFTDRVNEITDGAGVDVVYDAIGKDTFEAGLNCLGVRGHMVAYGNASGRAEPLVLSLLAA